MFDSINMSNENKINIFAVGDIMLGDLPHNFGFGVGSVIEKHSPLFPFTNCSHETNRADILFGNLEVVLSAFDRKSPNIERTILRGQPNAVEGLSFAGFDVLSLANNHIMQHGRKAIEETINALNKKEIKYVGIEIPESSIYNQALFEINGISICFLGYNLRPQQYFIDPPLYVEGTFERIKNDIEKQRKNANITVISLHWGDEFINRPSPEQIELAHRIIDCGADIILGHHPHILQGVEKYKGKIIAYSLGNFIFDMWQKRLRESMILKIEITDDFKMDFNVIPIFINSAYQPLIADSIVGDKIAERLKAISKEIKNDINSLVYENTVKMELRRYRREVYWHYITNLFRYDPRFIYLNFLGAIKRRMKRSNDQASLY
jgi:gamma-polyglutamate biosynthesis protein CapA